VYDPPFVLTIPSSSSHVCCVAAIPFSRAGPGVDSMTAFYNPRVFCVEPAALAVLASFVLSQTFVSTCPCLHLRNMTVPVFCHNNTSIAYLFPAPGRGDSSGVMISSVACAGAPILGAPMSLSDPRRTCVRRSQYLRVSLCTTVSPGCRLSCVPLCFEQIITAADTLHALPPPRILIRCGSYPAAATQ